MSKFMFMHAARIVRLLPASEPNDEVMILDGQRVKARIWSRACTLWPNIVSSLYLGGSKTSGYSVCGTIG
jgi:hypothetical protein